MSLCKCMSEVVSQFVGVCVYMYMYVCEREGGEREREKSFLTMSNAVYMYLPTVCHLNLPNYLHFSTGTCSHTYMQPT